MDGWITIGTQVETKSFDKQISYIEDKLETLDQEIKNLEKVEPADSEVLSKARKEYEQLSNQLIRLRQNQDDLNKSNNNFNIDGIIKKLSRFTLALFGVRGAFTIISKASRTYMSSNEQLSNQLENNWAALGTILGPIIEYVVKLIRKAVTAILYFVSLLTGVNYIAKANESALKKQSKATDGLAKSTKKANKELAHFDELNVLNKNAGVGGGLGTGLNSAELFDENELSEKLRENLKKIADFLKSEIYPIALKLWNNVLKPMFDFFAKNPDLLIGIIGGIMAFKLGDKIGKLATLLGGSSAGLIGGLVLLDAVLVTLASNGIKKVLENHKELQQTMEDLIAMTKSSNKNWKENTDKMVENAKQGKNTTEQNEKLVDGLLNTIEADKHLNEQIQEQNTLAQILTGTYSENKEMLKLNKDEISDNVSKLQDMYKQGLLNDEQKQKFSDLIWDEVRNLQKENENLDINSSKYQENKKKIDNLIKSFEEITGSTYVAELDVKADTSKAKSKLSNFFSGLGGDLFASLFPGLGLARTLSKISKLAKGGIVNMPGPGVPVGGAIAGERGAEGVIPLTDSQQMSLLGEAIGKYITINLTNNTNLDGRIIDRRITQVHSNNNFMTNR